MAGFRVRQTGEHLVTLFALQEYRKGKGGVPAEITADWLKSVGIDPVFEGPQAQPTDQYGYSQFAGLEQVDGKWYTKYIVGPVFTNAQEESEYKARRDAEQAESVRNTRNQNLAECDWTQLADSPVDKMAWATYRQSLRDVPNQAGFPWTIEWPVKP